MNYPLNGLPLCVRHVCIFIFAMRFFDVHSISFIKVFNELRFMEFYIDFLVRVLKQTSYKIEANNS